MSNDEDREWKKRDWFTDSWEREKSIVINRRSLLFSVASKRKADFFGWMQKYVNRMEMNDGARKNDIVNQMTKLYADKMTWMNS